MLPLYNQLVIILRSTLAPSGGNNDNIVAPLTNLLCLAQEIAGRNEEEDVQENYQVDVMDYIFNEMHGSMVNHLTVPYAPFIMILIQNTLRGHDFSKYSMQKHPFKKVYNKKKTVITQPSHASAPASGSFMGDARRSAPMPSTVPSFAPQVKKLNWF